jgi:hypothetical protein
MTELRAAYYDGRSAAGRPVVLRFDAEGALEIAGLDEPQRFPPGSVHFSPRVGSIPRIVSLPTGAQCETEAGAAANDVIDAVLARRGVEAPQRVLHRLESRWLYLPLLLALTVAVVWGAVKYVVPGAARHAAFAIPVGADRSMARGTLDALDRGLLSPSGLAAARQTGLRDRFADITRGLDDRHEFRLEFRDSPLLGPNALALPDGTIVMTDALVALATREEELIGMLAHEIGHVVHRHALRSVLQSSSVALIVALATGDLMSLTSLAAALPTMLVEAKFSRDFELEADHYALRFLREHRIPPRHAADLLDRMAQRDGREAERFGYLSSHPATEERIRLFAAER